MSKIKCFNYGEYGHFAPDCPKACNNAYIVQESQQNKKVKNLLDLDNISISKECAMMCTEVQYEDEDIVVYWDQGISTEEYEKAMYGKLMKTQSEEEEEIKYNMALCTNDSVSLEKKRRRLNKTTCNKYIHNVSQSDISLNDNRCSDIQKCRSDQSCPHGLRNYYFYIPSTTNNLMNNHVPKVSAPLKDYTNIRAILDPKLRTQDCKQAQAPVGTSSGLFIIHDTERSSYPIEPSLNDSKRDHLKCSRPHAQTFF